MSYAVWGLRDMLGADIAQCIGRMIVFCLDIWELHETDLRKFGAFESLMGVRVERLIADKYPDW